MKDLRESKLEHGASRRAFIQKGLVAGTAVVGAGLVSTQKASGQIVTPPTPGDVAILRFLAAAELIEADLWQQYAELGGLTPGQSRWRPTNRSRP